MHKSYILVPERSNFIHPFLNSANLLGKLILQLQLDSLKLIPVTWRKALTDSTYQEKIQIVLLPVSNIYKVFTRKSRSNKKTFRRFLGETTDLVAKWDLENLPNLKMVIVVKWTDSLNMNSNNTPHSTKHNHILSFDTLKELGVKIVYLELENDKSVFETFLYFICSISKASLKAKSLSSYFQIQQPQRVKSRSSRSSSYTVDNCKEQLPISIGSMVVLFIGLETKPAQMMAEALSKLFSVQVIYHQHTEMAVSYKFEKDLKYALSRANVIVLADDMFVNRRHWDSLKLLLTSNSFKTAYDIDRKQCILDEKELALIRPGTHVIVTTRSRSVNLQSLRNQVRKNRLGFVCVCLPIDCEEEDVCVAEEISVLDSVLILPASTSYQCTPQRDLDAFIDLIMHPIKEFHAFNNKRRDFAEYKFTDHHLLMSTRDEASKVVSPLSPYLNKLTEMLHTMCQCLVNEHKLENLKQRLAARLSSSHHYSSRRSSRTAMTNSSSRSRSNCSEATTPRSTALAESMKTTTTRLYSLRSSSMAHIPEMEKSLVLNETTVSLDCKDPWNCVKKELRALVDAPLAVSEQTTTNYMGYI